MDAEKHPVLTLGGTTAMVAGCLWCAQQADDPHNRWTAIGAALFFLPAIPMLAARIVQEWREKRGATVVPSAGRSACVMLLALLVGGLGMGGGCVVMILADPTLEMLPIALPGAVFFGGGSLLALVVILVRLVRHRTPHRTPPGACPLLDRTTISSLLSTDQGPVQDRVTRRARPPVVWAGAQVDLEGQSIQEVLDTLFPGGCLVDQPRGRTSPLGRASHEVILGRPSVVAAWAWRAEQAHVCVFVRKDAAGDVRVQDVLDAVLARGGLSRT